MSQETPRRCRRCGQRACCTRITRHTLNTFIPTGTTWDYRCEGCAFEFHTLSVLRLLGAFAAGFVSLPLAAMFIQDLLRGGITRSVSSYAWHIVATLACAVGGPFLLYDGARSLFEALRNPKSEAGTGRVLR